MTKSIQVGDLIPDFSFKDHDGIFFDIASYRGKRPLAVMFFPFYGSNGCESGDCNSHDLTEYFDKAGVALFGISGQPPESLKASKTMNGLRFPIYFDQDNKIRELFGIPVLKIGKYSPVLSLAFGVNSGRITFVTSAEGKIIYKTDSQLQSECQSKEADIIYQLLFSATGVSSSNSTSDS